MSSKDQHEYRQLTAMHERGIPPERIFVEKLSGKDIKRPVLQSLMNKVQKGDTVVVESISRFARNTKDLLNLVEKLTKKGVEFISLKEHIDTTTPTGRFTLTIFAAVAELEREHILQRQAEGIVAAKARGVCFGRPIKKPPENFAKVVRQWERGNISFDEALGQTGLKQATFTTVCGNFGAARNNPNYKKVYLFIKVEFIPSMASRIIIGKLFVFKTCKNSVIQS